MTTPNPQNYPVQNSGAFNTPQPYPNTPQQGFSNNQQPYPSNPQQSYPSNQSAPYQGYQQQSYAPNNGDNGYGQMMGYFAPMQTKPYQGQSWIAALLLCLFLGGLGVHNFYLAKKGAGLAQLTLSFIGVLTTGVVLGWLVLAVVGLSVFIDFIRILLSREKFD